ncbi:glycosyl transferase family 1 [Halobacteriales archaeon QH_3_68_24]|jgi:glycosyltransferase involved in cell wall biosynthesis|nr:MAG: glycosyl transferase family 1 [Halobacteriales archaeon QH_3_68_24]
MALPSVAAFTDTYLPTVNGATYTIDTWRDQWVDRGGRMHVVYPDSDHDPAPDEHPVSSVPFPFYEGFRVGLPGLPDAVADIDLVHAHTPFSLGLAGLRLARKHDLPVVASYHTPTSEYAAYLAFTERIERAIERSAEGYERRFLDRVDLVIAPSERTATHIREAVETDTHVVVVPNGVDVDFFRPVDPTAFRERHDLPAGPLVGYTGRHGYEKALDDIVAAAEDLDVTLVFGGDGPAREALEAQARTADVDARFLGFLDRAELPAFYAALDAFAFPSPVETQGIVALEANACGTPVAGVASAALADTIDQAETGYKAPPGDVAAFRDVIARTLDERERLREECLARREAMSVARSVDRLADVYDDVLGARVGV